MLTSLVIQAGGESRRMGQDKALVPFLGKPLIERVIAQVGVIGDEILITSNQAQELAFLGLPCFPDIYPGLGALSGLYTALYEANYPLVAVVACDMPFASLSLLKEERQELLESDADAVVPQTERGAEPFHAVYRRETCLPLVKAALDAGERRLISWFPHAKVVLYEERSEKFPGSTTPFENVNTPEELRIAEERARQAQSGEAFS